MKLDAPRKSYGLTYIVHNTDDGFGYTIYNAQRERIGGESGFGSADRADHFGAAVCGLTVYQIAEIAAGRLDSAKELGWVR